MTSRTENARKRKQTTTIPETVLSSDDDQKKSKARRVSTDALTSNAASQQTTDAASVANTKTTKNGETYKSIGQMIQDLFCSDNAKVNAALGALRKDLIKDKKKCDKIQAVGGCLALVLLLTKCLDKAIESIPACDQVTELNELAELTTLYKTLDVITDLTFNHDESKVGIVAIGGVEAVVKVMKTFPKCQSLQEYACRVLINLGACSIGKAIIIESGGIELLLTAVNNHLGSVRVCENACWALCNSVNGSKESTELLITLGGGAVVAKVRRKWSDNEEVQTQVRRLNNMIVAEMKTWTD